MQAFGLASAELFQYNRSLTMAGWPDGDLFLFYLLSFFKAFGETVELRFLEMKGLMKKREPWNHGA